VEDKGQEEEEQEEETGTIKMKLRFGLLYLKELVRNFIYESDPLYTCYKPNIFLYRNHFEKLAQYSLNH